MAKTDKNTTRYYEQLKTPPTGEGGALKTIEFGPLKGKSDINPQWRYEKMTEVFGPCGIGWKYNIDDHFFQPLPDGQLMVYVRVSLSYKDGETWSEPISAFGGDYVIKKDKNGIRGNDEAMKMAVTDALGTAMKMLGVAADVYRGLVKNGVIDSKYARREDANKLQQQADDLEIELKGYRHNLQNAATLLQIPSEGMRKIIKAVTGRDNSKQLSINEINDITLNLEKYAEKYLGGNNHE